MANELITSWGWGRPQPPRKFEEVLAWQLFPWWWIYALNLSLSVGVTYAIAGWPHTSTWSPYAYFTLLPATVLLLALPTFAAVMVLHSWLWSPDNGGSTLEQHWVLKNPAFAQRWRGKRVPILTLYEAYFAGDIDLKSSSSDGTEGDLLATLYERRGYSRFVIEWEHVKFFLFKFLPELATHSRVQDVTQVREHYDRGDDFYAAFLGPTMVYTSGIFNDEDDTLEQAQVNKMNLVANKIHLKRGEQHLDLGCGWGTFIAHCAKEFGTESTGVTLGLNQTQFANTRCKEAGVSDSARALCADYRDVPRETNNKKFNKITCLEMSEHVGVKYYPAFCKQVSDMLEDDGLFFLQIAGLRRPWQFEDLLWGLFMGNYVFPGADASCPLSWVITQLECAGFEIHTVETVGIHYSATIKRWYDNWRKNEKQIKSKYGQRWFRLWLWFLAWSVISPEHGMATCYQIVAHKNTSRFDRKQFIAERKYYKI